MLHSDILLNKKLSYKKKLHQLLSEYENKKYDNIIKPSQNYMPELEKSALALNLLACSCLKLDYKKDALLYLKSALVLNPSYQDTYSNMGKVFHQVGNLEESEKFFQKACDLSIEKKKNAKTITENISLREITDGDFETFKLLFDIGDWWEARNTIENYIKNIGSNAIVQSFYGYCIFKTGNSEKGINILLNVVEKDLDTDFFAETLLIICLLEQRKFTKAQKFILKYQFDIQNNTLYKEICAILHIFLNNNKKSINSIKQINEKTLDSYYPYLYEVLISFLDENFDQSTFVLSKLNKNKLLKKRMFGIETISKRAFIHLLNKVLRTKIKKNMNENVSKILDFLGNILISLKELDLAIKIFEKSQTIVSSHERSLNISKLYFIKSDWEKAKQIAISLWDNNLIAAKNKNELREILSRSLFNIHNTKLMMEKLDGFDTYKNLHDQNKLMAHLYPNICVFYTNDLYGGGIRLEKDYIKFVKNRFGQVDSLFEWCAGPGYLGYSMLAHGITKKLCLADINPKAVQYANKTCKENLLGKDVSIYLSDNMDQVSKREKFDLVIGNPPHFSGDSDFFSGIDRRGWDEDWKIHKKFFSQIGPFLKPDGRLCIMEWEDPNISGSSNKNTFRQMIEQNNLIIEETIDCELVADHYYLIVKKRK